MITLKALFEKRNSLVDKLSELAERAATETRAFTDEEKANYDSIKAEIVKLDATIAASEELRDLERKDARMMPTAVEKSEEALQTKAFEYYLRGKALETRGEDTNLTRTDNGAMVPSFIANKIIDKIKEISPLFAMATRYNIKGTLTIPYYDTSSGDITVALVDEFEELTSTSGKFLSISLTGYLAGVLCKISKSLINNSNFDIVGFVINKTAENAADWIEDKCINGITSKIDGLSTLTPAVTATAATYVLADELIDLQESIPDKYQGSAVWIMNRATRKAIRKLKDGEGNYLLNRDFSARWGYTLLGKDVYISKNAPAMAANAKAIYYGDYSGLAIKLAEEMEISVAREKFATQHAIGIFGYMEIDAKVENSEKIAVLKMGAADPQ